MDIRKELFSLMSSNDITFIKKILLNIKLKVLEIGVTNTYTLIIGMKGANGKCTCYKSTPNYPSYFDAITENQVDHVTPEKEAKLIELISVESLNDIKKIKENIKLANRHLQMMTPFTKYTIRGPVGPRGYPSGRCRRNNTQCGLFQTMNIEMTFYNEYISQYTKSVQEKIPEITEEFIRSISGPVGDIGYCR
jgi:hypothetical protein